MSLHGKANQSKIFGGVEIRTFVSTFQFPDRYTPESLGLKKSIIDCNKKDVFRTGLI